MVTIKRNNVEFRFFRPLARQVYLAGDFNRWRITDLPMRRQAGGYWSIRLALPDGEFRFRYLADGQWFTDYAAFGVEEGPLGVDSIVRVRRRGLVQIESAEKTRLSAPCAC
jgi:1,4-alpha-glucan branching enzyme